MKPLVVALLVIVIAPVARADYAGEVVKDGSVAWWRFADAATADGTVAKDETGHHVGVYHGNTIVVDGVPGIGGKAAQLDGKTAYLEVPNYQDFALNTFSVECWFRSTQSWTGQNWPASATLISKATEGNASRDWVLLGGASEGKNGVVMARPGPAGGTDYSLASPPAMNTVPSGPMSIPRG